MLILLVNAEKNVFGCEKEELRWHERDGEEKRSRSLDIRRLFGADGDTESSGEGLLDLGSRVRGGGGFVQLCRANDLNDAIL